MNKRKIHTEAFWREELAITDQDVQDIGALFMESEHALTGPELARSLIRTYCEREGNLVRRRLSMGTVYRPNGTYAVGDKVVFPHLDFAVGTVVDQREGHNPEYDRFKVIAVQLEDGDGASVRQFAAELSAPHNLSFSTEEPWLDSFEPSPDALYDRYGDLIAAKLEDRLRSDLGFVYSRGRWLLKDMLADVHVGLLNIAEAMLDLHGKPLPPTELLRELDLPDEIPESVQVFSLNYAMSRDDRFQDVGDANQVVWGLRRRIPEEVVHPPSRLHYDPISYNRTALDVVHLQLEREIDDEASALIAPPKAASATLLSLVLKYPHWRCGTLPLTAQTRAFFPAGTPSQRTQITFVDRANRKQFPGWVAHRERFVYGLAEWYEANQVPVGAHIRLERTDDLHRVVIELIPRRMQREWVRVVYRDADGELGLQMQKRPISCEYDELFLLGEADRATVDELWSQEQTRERSLGELVTATFLELGKLSPSVRVHAKTLYNAVNVVRRCPPGPVFAKLFELPEFVTTGDGYWVYQGHSDVR
ncbi:MAG: hypothetical protein ISS56_10270 [Anaerolineae bacterium]|nr:hypothetical protein [Anaerolineae bacterium]